MPDHLTRPPKTPLPAGSADEYGGRELQELALDLRSTWNHATDEVWRQLDPALWELTQNPWVVLQTVSKNKLKSVLADPVFRKKVDDQLQARRQAAETPAWFQERHPQSALKCVAYFSMEYMLSEALPIYSGGLGNVAGDQLKAASDLGVPVVGVGLLYLEEEWSTLRFGEVKVKTDGNQHAFEIQVYCGDLDPNAVRVELYADVDGKPPFRQEMMRGQSLDGTANGYFYRAAVSAGRPATDYTARVIPHCDDAAIPLEESNIRWQR